MTKIYLPPEWESQDAVLVTWPHMQSDWQHDIEQVSEVYYNFVTELSKHTRVIIIASDAEQQTQVAKKLTDLGVNPQQLTFFVIPTNDTWIRDYGPITLKTPEGNKAYNFFFNAWGEKYKFDLDNEVTTKLFSNPDFANTELQDEDFVLEGGSIEVDGQGTLITTRHCLLHTYRNPKFSQDDIENYLKQKFNLKRVIWLYHGDLIGDDTDGHVDTIVRFLDPQTLCYMQTDDRDDENFRELYTLEKELEQLTTIHGEHYDLVPLPLPKPIYNKKGDRLPASYVNFLISNGVIFFPTYSVAEDDIAMDRLAKAVGDKFKIVPINCRALIEQFGSLHCITMQLPKGTLT